MAADVKLGLSSRKELSVLSVNIIAAEDAKYLLDRSFAYIERIITS